MHLLKNSTSLFKIGSNVFRVREKYSYVTTPISGTYSSPRSFSYDVPNNRIFIANSGAGTVSVINATTFALIATITGFSTPQTTIVDPNPANNRIIVGYNGGIKILDGTSFSVLQTVTSAFGFVLGLAFDPINANNRLFTTDVGSGKVTVLETIGFTAIHTMPGFSSPCGIQFDPTNSNIFAFCDAGTVRFYDATTLAEINHYSIPGEYIAFDPVAANDRFLTATGGAVRSYRNSSKGLIETISVGVGSSAVAFDPTTTNNRWFVTDLSTSLINQITQTQI